MNAAWSSSPGEGPRAARLGRRVVARYLAHARPGALADEVMERHPLHEPPRLAAARVPTATAAASAPAAAPAQEPVPHPAGMSEWTARWLFGDGPVEGVPFVGGAMLADATPAVQRTPASSERPALDGPG